MLTNNTKYQKWDEVNTMLDSLTSELTLKTLHRIYF